MKLKELGSIRHIIFGFLAIMLMFILLSIYSTVNAAVNPSSDNIVLDVQCANGRFGRGKCPEGQELALSTLDGASVLDIFSYTTIPDSNSTGDTPENTLLWNQYENDFTEGPDPGTEQTSTDKFLFGTRSLNINVTGGNIYAQFYNYSNFGWNWVRDKITRGTWQYDTYNRMKFYMHVPAGQIAQTGTGQKNFTFGTYIREEGVSQSSAESPEGGHFYHNFDLKSLDANSWWQIEIDFHPNHERGLGGGIEHGSKEYVTGDAGRNYFDQTTRFYMEFDGPLSSYPQDYYLDGFHYYTANPLDDIDQIYSIAYAHVATTNETIVTWARRKDQGTQTFDIKYAFTDIYDLGYENATAAPSGSGITPVNAYDYQTMYYSTTAIDVTGQDKLYIAIKAVGSNVFRQIEVAITNAGLPALEGL